MKEAKNILQNLNCFQVSLENICHRYHKDFRLIFTQEWGFFYEKNPKIPIGERIHVPYAVYMNHFLEEYIGFKVDFHKETDNLPELMEKAERAGTTLLLSIDSYECYWNPTYQKAHIPHFCIIEEWNSSQRLLVCRDVYLSDQKHLWDYASMLRAYRNLRVLQDIGQEKRLSLKEVNKLLITNYQQLPQNPGCYYEDFADAVAGMKDIGQLFNQKEAAHCLLFHKVRMFTVNRYEISRLLRDHTEKEGGQIAKEFYCLWEQWEILKLLFIRLFVNKKITREKIQCIRKQIIEIGIQEERQYERMIGTALR